MPVKKDIHYFGIRHHGPGSTRRLLAALARLKPAKVLIEGPTDCSEFLPQLAHQQMKPPVALLGYAAQESQCSIYYPFTQFSPEYQACLWSVDNEVEVAFIDWPIAVQLAQMLKEKEAQSTLFEQQEQQADNDIQPPIEKRRSKSIFRTAR